MHRPRRPVVDYRHKNPVGEPWVAKMGLIKNVDIGVSNMAQAIEVYLDIHKKQPKTT
jgi:hypothetical protein